MNFILTGWTGNVGSLFLAYFREILNPGDEVYTAGRTNADFYFSLEEGFINEDKDVFFESHLIHAAYDWQSIWSESDINVQSLHYLKRWATRNHASITLIGSFSADMNSLSKYAQSKAKQELALLEQQKTQILRLGVIEDADLHYTSKFLRFYSRLPIQIIPKTSAKFVYSNLFCQVKCWYQGQNLLAQEVPSSKYLTLEQLLSTLKSPHSGNKFRRCIEIDVSIIIPVLVKMRDHIPRVSRFLDSLLVLCQGELK